MRGAFGSGRDDNSDDNDGGDNDDRRYVLIGLRTIYLASVHWRNRYLARYERQQLQSRLSMCYTGALITLRAIRPVLLPHAREERYCAKVRDPCRSYARLHHEPRE